jgi:hypothetical protein
MVQPVGVSDEPLAPHFTNAACLADLSAHAHSLACDTGEVLPDEPRRRPGGTVAVAITCATFRTFLCCAKLLINCQSVSLAVR